MKFTRPDFRRMLDTWSVDTLRSAYDSVTERQIDAALKREHRDARDLIALLSPRALPLLEEIAREANRITRRHFGRAISLYAPLYLSNVCAADCLYCGFSTSDPIPQERTTLTAEEIARECEALAALGYRNVLLLTGDAPTIVPPAYIAEASVIARRYFSAIAVEIYAMSLDEYRLLCDHGLDGITLYVETYDRDTYGRMHRKGRKRDYDFRLEAVERAAEAGARRISIGVLLGLFDWRLEAVWLGMHARYLQKYCPHSAISVSFPRLLHAPAHFTAPCPVSDRDLAQMMVALRLFLPEAGFNLSTRERPDLRDRLVPLGITSMSAGSSTRPGGYATPARERLAQFETEDKRTPAEVAAMLRAKGYDPVWKDYDPAFVMDVSSRAKDGAPSGK